MRLDVDIDPLGLGAESGLLWSRDTVALAGLGEARRIRFARPGRISAAQQELAALSGSDELRAPGSGPVAFAALPFNPTADGELIVPEIVVGRASEGRRWLTITDDGSLTKEAALNRVSSTIKGAELAEPEPTRLSLASEISPEAWKDLVAEAVSRISRGNVNKVVLARRLDIKADQPFSPAVIVGRLAATFPMAALFLVDGFVGASPELLVSRNHDIVRAHPLAGTAKRSSVPATDSQLAACLLGSSKDRLEHQITIDWLLRNLLPFCSYVDAEPEPTIVSLANVHHLGTLVEGRLSDPAASVLELVSSLHPTPAVGGDPQLQALSLIREFESSSRGRYAGPVGWLDAEGNGAFAVAVRSAQLSETGASLFAGVGVVADSDSELELAETRAKFQALLGALVSL